MSFISDQVADNNIKFVREQILQKNNYCLPYYPRTNDVNRCITDMDNFPYNRYYRGQSNANYPIVYDRAAGWRPRFDKEYSATPYLVAKSEPTNHCFESPCSTVYPCFPEYAKRYGDLNALEIMLNRTCVDKSP